MRSPSKLAKLRIEPPGITSVVPRPLPTLPRGPRRRRRGPATALLLACPRVCPEWELNAIRALIKPQLKGAIQHRSSQQVWPRDAESQLKSLIQQVRQRIGFEPDLHLSPAGDYFFVAAIPPAEVESARALALVLSAAFPDLWLVLDRLFVRNGRFFRRQRGLKLNLVPATNIHLSRPVRAALRGYL